MPFRSHATINSLTIGMQQAEAEAVTKKEV